MVRMVTLNFQYANVISNNLQGICDIDDHFALLCVLFDGTTGTTGATYMYGNNNGEFGMKLQLESRLVTGTFDINDYTDNVNALTEPIELAQSINWESFFTTWWPSDAIDLDITLGAYVSFEADATQDRVDLCVGLTDDETNVCIYWIADTTTCVVDVDDNEVCYKTCNDGGADACDSDEYCLELFFLTIFAFQRVTTVTFVCMMTMLATLGIVEH